MNIPKGFKLVPVELTQKMLTAYAEASIAPIGPISKYGYEAMLAAAPAPPQPIYDEAKERELFENYCAKVGLPVDTLPSGEYLIPATRFMSQGWHARAKAGEDE